MKINDIVCTHVLMYCSDKKKNLSAHELSTNVQLDLKLELEPRQ